MMDGLSVRSAAEEWLAAGCSVVPVRGDGSKAPAVPWKRWQQERPGADDVAGWFPDGDRAGVGVVCGAVSGGVEMVEFEGRAVAEGLVKAASAAMAAHDLSGLWSRLTVGGCVEGSPSGGVHLFMRVVGGAVAGNTKLARRPSTAEELAAAPGCPVQVLIETRGEGGYVVVAPSGGTVHRSGRPWTRMVGGPSTIPEVTVEEVEAFHAVMSTLDRVPVGDVAAVAPLEGGGSVAVSPANHEGVRPGDAFNVSASWDDILCPEGWTKVRRDGTGWLWSRPGKDGRDGVSASTGTRGDGDNLYVWSTSTEFEAERPMSKLFVWAHYRHGGDMSAAARQLSADGWGDRPDPERLTFDGSVASGADSVCGVGVSAAAADWWDERSILAHVRAFALARMCSPAAVLGCVLERALSTVPVSVVLPPIIGGVGSLNLFCALVGPSGSGKGAAESAAADCVKFGEEIFTAPLGSGEGIAHCYSHFEPGGKGEKPYICEDRYSVLFTVPEIDTMGAIAVRKGSTLMEQLRSAYSGERLGFSYASAEKKVVLQPHRYRLTLIAGVQPLNAGPLVDDDSGGTPQRFIWMPAVDSAVSADPVPCPDPVMAPRVRWDGLPLDLSGHRLISVPDVVVSTVRAVHAARARGEGDVLDGHALFTREKVAVALAVLDGRAYVSEDDWGLAGRVMALSDVTRAGIGRVIAEDRLRRLQAISDRDAEIRDNSENAVADRRVARVTACVLRLVAAAGGDGWISSDRVKRRITSRDRGVFEEAVLGLVDEGRVEMKDDDPGNGRPCRMLRVKSV